MCRLSIMIPVYNEEKYIGRCLDSVISQKYEDLEIIIIDDGSVDNTGAICKKHATEDNRIKYIYKENGGLVEARKTALQYATGDYVTCVDADDWIEENAYDGLMEIMKKYNPDIIACSFIKQFEGIQAEREDYPDEGYYTKEKFHEIIRESVDNENFFCQVISATLCCKVYKKEIYEKYQKAVPSEIILSEDMAVTLPMILNVDSIYISKKPYYHYCQNKKSVLWRWKKGEYQKLIILTTYLKEFYNSCKDELIKKLILYSVYFAMTDVLYDIPDVYFCDRLPFLPNINKGDNIVIYGKGVFALNLLYVVEKYNLYNIVSNVDSSDAENLFKMDDTSYDHVVIGILDYKIVGKIKTYLLENGVLPEKITSIDKNDLNINNLPKGLKEVLW